MYINKLNAIVDEYNNTNNRTIKMKPADVKPNTYFDFDIESKDKDPRFEVGDCVRISKYKNIFAKCFILNLYKEVFMIKKVKNPVTWAYAIEDLNGEDIVGTFSEKELWNIYKTEFRVKK